MITVKIPVQDTAAVKIAAAASGTVQIGSQPVVNALLGETYTGDYVVEPDLEPIVLATRFKSMTDDVTVKKIPVWETSNDSGGTTCLIGGEKYYGLQ